MRRARANAKRPGSNAGPLRQPTNTSSWPWPIRSSSADPVRFPNGRGPSPCSSGVPARIPTRPCVEVLLFCIFCPGAYSGRTRRLRVTLRKRRGREQHGRNGNQRFQHRSLLLQATRQTSRLRRCSAFSRLRLRTDLMSMNRPSSSCRNFVFKWRGSQARISDSAIRRVLAGLAGHAVANPPTAVARKQKVSQSFQTDLPRPVLREKRIPFARNPNQSYKSRHPGPQEGRIAIVTNVGPGCGGRDSARRVMGRAGRVFP